MCPLTIRASQGHDWEQFRLFVLSPCCISQHGADTLVLTLVLAGCLVLLSWRQIKTTCRQIWVMSASDNWSGPKWLVSQSFDWLLVSALEGQCPSSLSTSLWPLRPLLSQQPIGAQPAFVLLADPHHTGVLSTWPASFTLIVKLCKDLTWVNQHRYQFINRPDNSVSSSFIETEYTRSHLLPWSVEHYLPVSSYPQVTQTRQIIVWCAKGRCQFETSCSNKRNLKSHTDEATAQLQKRWKCQL